MLLVRVVRVAAYVMVGSALVTLIALQVKKAPYGKHSAGKDGVKAQLAWIAQECPSLLMVLGLASTGDKVTNPANLALLCMFTGHYLYRSVVYPIQMRSEKRVPFSIVCAAFAFTLFNGTLQGAALAHVHTYPDGWMRSPRFIVGTMLFFSGLATHIHADRTLRKLRLSGGNDKTYHIPHGGMFNFVSSPNYFGEIVEWTGFAVAASSLPAAAFALFTIANIGPRAFQTHAWYKEKFSDEYPQQRKALVPFVI